MNSNVSGAPTSSRGGRTAVVATATVGLVVLFVNVFWHDRLYHGGAKAEAAAPAEAIPSIDPAKTVVLAEGKLNSAGIVVEAATSMELPTEVSVAGMVEANPDRYLDIHPRVTGVIRSALGEIGAKVKAGDELVVIDSVEVGKARLDLRARQRELATARTQADWKREVSDNVEALIPLLKKNMETKEITSRFVGKPLGAFRATLLGNYAEYEIARHEEEKQTDLYKKEIVGEHPYFLAIHQREGKQAKFEAELEQVRFDSSQQRKIAEQDVRDAEAAVIDAAQRLRLLGVTEDLDALLARDAASTPLSSANYEDVTKCSITAPFDGIILERTAALSQRVDVSDVLFTVVDPSNVRIQANVPESMMAVLPKLKDAKVAVHAAAYPDRAFEARIVTIGSDVDPRTRTVALRASAPNPDGLLKIGLFVRMTIDGAATESVVTVPSGAVVEIGPKTGVFLPGDDPRTFHFHAVKAGRETAGRRVIPSGLKPGAKVVSRGAFLLKSELVLQNETEED